MAEPLIAVRDLQVHFPVREGIAWPGRQPKVVRAVDGVSFDILPGEMLAMVGESGCGKTTTGKAILQLIRPTAGEVVYGGENLNQLKGSHLRKMRRKMQLIFQDPYESLDPRQSVFDILAEPLVIHERTLSAKQKANRVYASLEAAGLQPAREIAERFPHHLSGGQRQRVAIAAAMILEPEFIVTDEPVSMLDVSIRAGILQLMQNLRQMKNLTYLFITHDLSLACVIADRILVLYLGKVVEVGQANQVIHRALHPYTQSLVSVIPLPEPLPGRKQIILEGETPSPIDIPQGCRFRPRCWLFENLGQPKKCTAVEPELRDMGEGHQVACHFENGDSAHD